MQHLFCYTHEGVLLLKSANNGWMIAVMFYVCRYVFISQKAYQETETRPESSVYTEMRGVAMLGDFVQDTTEYVRPSEVRDQKKLINCT